MSPSFLSCHQATLETFYGVGYIVGPTIGGLLFQAGGYILPFIVMGAMLCIVGVITFFVLPPSGTQKKPQGESRLDVDLVSPHRRHGAGGAGGVGETRRP